MALGISSYAFGWSIGIPDSDPPAPLTPFDLLASASEHRVRVVQIADNMPLDAYPIETLDALGEQAGAQNLLIEVGTRGIEPEHLRTYLAIARRFNSPILRVVIDTPRHKPDIEDVIHAIRSVIGEFEQAGVCLAIENHDRFTARMLEHLMRRIDSSCIGICLDTANSLGAGEGIEAIAEKLATWIVNLHVKDFTIQRVSNLMGFIVEGRPAGQGDLDIPWLLDYLATNTPRPVNAILELWPPAEDSLSATIAKERAWVASSLRYLRHYIQD